MPDEIGTWLRAQRQARGWNIPETARQLRAAAKATGDKSVPGNKALCTYIRRWERGQIEPSERYKLHYCKTFGIPPAAYGHSTPQHNPPQLSDALTTAAIPATPGSPASPLRALVPSLILGPGATALPQPPEAVYRETKGPGMGNSPVEREVLMAAHEGSEHAEQAERRDIGDATLEQLRADVARLSHGYMTGEPFPLFMEMRRVRDRMHAALDRRLWPRDAVELYFLLSCVNGLMALAAHDLGSTSGAAELYRAGWAYAVAIDHRPLMARLRWGLANVTDWTGQPRQARDLSASGLSYLSDGPTGILLHLKHARMSARLGDPDTARRALAAASDAREREYHDELMEIGGEFDLSRASQHYLAGSALIEIPGAHNDAAAELDLAAELYAAGPGPGETHGYTMEALARIDLATARLRAGELDAAAAAAGTVLSLPPGKRVITLPQRFDQVRTELAHPRYQGSAQARDLDERIEDFTRDTIATGLRELPGGPA